MKCMFEYCIYNKNFKCTVSEVEINFFGMCDMCIMVSLDKELLEKEKAMQWLKSEILYEEITNDNKS